MRIRIRLARYILYHILKPPGSLRVAKTTNRFVVHKSFFIYVRWVNPTAAVFAAARTYIK